MTTENKIALNPSPGIQKIDLNLLSSDPDNIRKEYNLDSLNELALSLKEQGLIQNLESGPDGVVHLGNRRLRALKEIVVPELRREMKNIVTLEGEAADDEVVALRGRLDALSWPNVRVLSADEMKEAKIRQVIENLQREDVTAFDEAEGYAVMLAVRDDDGRPVHTPESIAKRIGKGQSGEYVRQRLKIRMAPAPMLKALASGNVGMRHCLVVGRIPDKKLRAEAAKKVLKPQYSDRALSIRETIDLVRKDYMVTLRKPPFDPDDASLVPGVGGCSACPARSGNDPDLAGDLQMVVVTPGVKDAAGSSPGVSPDICTNPACFRKKSDAAWKVVEAAAVAEGKSVLSADAAEDEFGGFNSGLRHNSKYIDLSDKPAAHVLGHYDDKKAEKWGVLLKDVDVPVILTRHPKSGRIHELVEMEQAKLALELEAAESGEVSIFRKDSENDETERLSRAAVREESMVRRRVAIAVFDKLSDAMSADDGAPTGEGGSLRRGTLLLLLKITLMSSADACGFFAKWLELEKAELPKDCYRAWSDLDYVPVFMDMVRARDVEYSSRDLMVWIALAAIAGGVSYDGVKCGMLIKFCEDYDVDMEGIEDGVMDEIAAEKAAGANDEKAAKNGGDK
ncbi:MAG: ParB N-terminal domain-containing protein [Verrucomicrobiota bacterium]